MITTKFKKMIGLFLLVAICITPVQTYAIETSDTEMSSIEYDRMFKEVMEFIKSSYIGGSELTEKQLFEAAMHGMFNELDPYSAFMTPKEEENFSNQLRSEYVGIGVQITPIGDYIGITGVFDGSPALDAGVKKGDYFVQVDGTDVKGFTTDALLKLVLGEEGTTVKITFGRAGTTYTKTLKRLVVKISSVQLMNLSNFYNGITQEQEKEIAYIQITNFTAKSDVEFEEAIKQAKEKGAKYLILDMRDNGGGYVNTAVNIAKKLVPEGPIVYFTDADGNETVYDSNNKDLPFEIVALVNKHSASATEFVAAAIQDSGVGKIVGETTYGKGVAQHILSYEQDYTIKLTMQEFFSRNKHKINKIGVIPDYQVIMPGFLYGDQKYYIYDKNEGVQFVEEILHYLGYDVGVPDQIFDRKTFHAVKKFQIEWGLYGYGACDFTTQAKLNEALHQSILKNDLQIAKAVDLFINR